MAILAFGIAGAAIGSATGIGAALGWSIATTFAGALYGPKAKPQERGRLDDTGQRIIGSSYGSMIPIVYGQSRVPGNIIWAGPIREDVQTTRVRVSKKQRQTIRQYSYSASFAFLLCEGPVDGVRKIWFEDVVVWDTEKLPPTQYLIRRYLGTHNQPVDPLLSQALGANDCPAYRYRCYGVAESLPIGNWGNRIPGISAEIACEAEGTPTWEDPDLLSFWPFEIDDEGGWFHLDDRGENEWHFITEPGVTVSMPMGVPRDGTDRTAIQAIPPTNPSGNAGRGGVKKDIPPQYATASNKLFGAQLTVAFWAKCLVTDAAPDFEDFQTEIGCYDRNTTPWKVRLTYDSFLDPFSQEAVATHISFHQTDGLGNNSIPLQRLVDFDLQQQNVELRKWRHVAMTWNGAANGRMRLWLDGILAMEVNTGAPTLEQPNVGGGPIGIFISWFFAGGVPAAVPMAGFRIDDLFIIARELTPDDLDELFEMGGF